MYQSGLKCQLDGDLDGAKDIYEQLLKKRILKEYIAPIQDIQDSPLHTLQFVVFKNYARVLEMEQNYPEALEYYLKVYSLI